MKRSSANLAGTWASPLILNDLKDWEGDGDNKLVAGQDVLAARPTLLLALALEGLGPAEREELLSLIHQCQSRTAVCQGASLPQGREAGREVPGARRGHCRRGRAHRAARAVVLPGRCRPR